MVTMFIFLGLLGLSLATWLIPFSFACACFGVRETPIRLLLNYFKQGGSALREISSSGSSRSSGSGDQRISILIPVHNEEQHLSATLESIQLAIENLHRSSPGVECNVHVALDNCSDQSALIASAFGFDCFDTRRPPGKWNTLRALAERSGQVDWVILCDAGSLWPPDFLLKLAPHFSNNAIAGLAPAYRTSGRAFYSRLFWWFESSLKSLENFCGGPVAVHGATVVYRHRAFLEAMNLLWDGNWKNDDVVLPLLIRSMQRGMKLLYLPALIVRDQGVQNKATIVSFWRRRRIARGNSEWIQKLWLSVAKRNPLVAIISLRRVFRLFWAYWIGLLIFGLFAQSLSVITLRPAVALVGILVLSLLIFRLRSRLVSLLYAGLASIEAPLWLLPVHRRDLRWA